MPRSWLLVLFAIASSDQAESAQAAPAGRSAPSSQAVAEASGNASWGESQAEDLAAHRGVDFILFNRTGRTIIALAIRPHEGPADPGVPEAPWGENILTQRELPDGQRAAAHYEPDTELCTWQLRATFEDGRSTDYPTVNLCETIRVDLR